MQNPSIPISHKIHFCNPTSKPDLHNKRPAETFIVVCQALNSTQFNIRKRSSSCTYCRNKRNQSKLTHNKKVLKKDHNTRRNNFGNLSTWLVKNCLLCVVLSLFRLVQICSRSPLCARSPICSHLQFALSTAHTILVWLKHGYEKTISVLPRHKHINLLVLPTTSSKCY